VAALVLASALTWGIAGPAGATSAAQVRARALSVSNLPAGWAVNHARAIPDCAQAATQGKGDARISVSYIDGQAPVLRETVEAGPSAKSVYRATLADLGRCRTVEITVGTQRLSGSVSPLPFSKFGSASTAYTVDIDDGGTTLGVDLVFFRTGSYFGTVSLATNGMPDVAQFRAFVKKAVAKL
jgi:hypothetical protein